MSALAGAAIGAYGLALYAGHHVGDYWVQSDHDAAHKGDEGWSGIRACLTHVVTYTTTQAVFMGAVSWVSGIRPSAWAFLGALLVSAVTHYLADRREYGIMFRIARAIPGKGRFLTLGVPRGFQIYAQSAQHGEPRGPVPLDNPSLGTGAWALDQAWHVFWGVFVAALIMGAGA